MGPHQCWVEGKLQPSVNIPKLYSLGYHSSFPWRQIADSLIGFPPRPPDPSLQICSPEYQTSEYTGALGGSSPGVGVCTSLCSITGLFCHPNDSIKSSTNIMTSYEIIRGTCTFRRWLFVSNCSTNRLIVSKPMCFHRCLGN